MKTHKILFIVFIIISLVAFVYISRARDIEYMRCENVLVRAEEGQIQNMKVFFNNAIERESREIDHILSCYLRKAQKSIDAHFYQANLENIRDELVAAKQRGVQVRFITDDHYYEDARYYPIFYDHLIAAGIPLKHDQMVKHTNGQSHNKFAIIDQEYLWTGSMNITHNGSSLNANNALYIHSPELASTFLTEFEEMWGEEGGMKFGNMKTANTINDHNIPGVGEVDVCFDPSDGCQRKTLEVLETADHAVYFAAFSFTDDAIGDLLVKKKLEQGVHIEGIFHRPECRYGEFKKLYNVSPDSIHLRSELKTVPRLIHHKFFIIDPKTDSDPIVITGSRNFSASSETKNDENTLIIHNKDIAQRYLDEFYKLIANKKETVFTTICEED